MTRQYKSRFDELTNKESMLAHEFDLNQTKIKLLDEESDKWLSETTLMKADKSEKISKYDLEL